jgi:hypothetical protein
MASIPGFEPIEAIVRRSVPNNTSSSPGSPGRCPSSSIMMPPRTHMDRGRQAPDDREFPCGTFSQAELTAELVTRRIQA